MEAVITTVFFTCSVQTTRVCVMFVIMLQLANFPIVVSQPLDRLYKTEQGGLRSTWAGKNLLDTIAHCVFMKRT